MRYLLLFLMVGSVMAEDFKVDPIQYDIPESKWGPPAHWYNSNGHCTDPMNLFNVCPSKGALLFAKKIADYNKKLAELKAKKNMVVVNNKPIKTGKPIKKHA